MLSWTRTNWAVDVYTHQNTEETTYTLTKTYDKSLASSISISVFFPAWFPTIGGNIPEPYILHIPVIPISPIDPMHPLSYFIPACLSVVGGSDHEKHKRHALTYIYIYMVPPPPPKTYIISSPSSIRCRPMAEFEPNISVFASHPWLR